MLVQCYLDTVMLVQCSMDTEVPVSLCTTNVLLVPYYLDTVQKCLDIIMLVPYCQYTIVIVIYLDSPHQMHQDFFHPSDPFDIFHPSVRHVHSQHCN